jgi:hypothetical protein
MSQINLLSNLEPARRGEKRFLASAKIHPMNQTQNKIRSLIIPPTTMRVKRIQEGLKNGRKMSKEECTMLLMFSMQLMFSKKRTPNKYTVLRVYPKMSLILIKVPIRNRKCKMM